MSIKMLIAPQRYVQGPGALSQIGSHLEIFGVTNPLILTSPSAFKACRDILIGSLEAGGLRYDFLPFARECTFEEIDRIKNVCLDGAHDAIISCGGGKAMDAGRAAAAGYAVKVGPSIFETRDPFGADVTCIQVPTVASSDAPTATISVVYNAEGVQEGVVSTRLNPSLVLVDTQIIAQAPVRTLVAGMGDALATYFEADMVHRSGRQAVNGAYALHTVLAIARLSYDILIEYGLSAKREVEAKSPGPALEKVVEANILLSGLGYESGGLAAAHAIANSFPILHDRFDKKPMHGELVAFSALTQLIMEERERELVDKVRDFCRDVGLPTTFEEMGLTSATDDMLALVANDAAKSGMIAAMPKAYKRPDSEDRYYDPEEIVRCMRETDAWEQ